MQNITGIYICFLLILISIGFVYCCNTILLTRRSFKVCHGIQDVREWSPKNFRVSLSRKMWSKTFILLLDKLNHFLKIKLFPVVLGLLKHCFVHKKILYRVIKKDKTRAIQLKTFFYSAIYNTATGYVLWVYLTDI
jgi:hypothetical protein